MTATNHVLSGAVIGAFLPLPVAIPLAFASHFVLDALPHFSVQNSKRNHHRIFRMIVYSDTILAIGLATTVVLFHKWAMLICGAAAFSPDAAHVIYYLSHGRDMNIKATNRFMAFHNDIQWYEKPAGLIIEIITALILSPIFISQLF